MSANAWGAADVACAILDGAPVDWASVRLDGRETEEPLLDDLRLLATIVGFHRDLLGAPAASPGIDNDFE